MSVKDSRQQVTPSGQSGKVRFDVHERQNGIKGAVSVAVASRWVTLTDTDGKTDGK
jgi:hypothetical protein